MSKITAALHGAFLRALGGEVLRHSDVRMKPLLVDLRLPNPPRLRVYMYSLVGSSRRRPNEYKVVARVPGQRVGEYGSFDHSEGRIALVVGYRPDLDVFALWDASLHGRFMQAANMRVSGDNIHTAAAIGRADYVRALSSKANEVVIACQSASLLAAIDDRVSWTGGLEVVA